MKRVKLLTLAIAASIAWHCSGPIPEPAIDTTPTPPVEEAAYVNLDEGQSSAISVGYEKSEITFSFTTNKDWTAELSYGSGTASWITLNKNNGKSGKQTLIATISENPEETNRSAVATIKAGDASANITISQNAFECDFSIAQKVIEVEAAGGTIEVSVTSNIGYHASTSVDWIHEISTKAAQTKSIWFTVDANESSEPRSGVIVICNDNEVCIPVTVNQAAGKATLSISASSLEFGYEGGERQVTVTSNADWTSECSADWCSVTPSSEMGECTVTVKVKGNTTDKSRSASITFKAGGSSKTLTISQKPFESIFDISTKSFDVDAAGGTIEVVVTSNIGYHASTSVDWIHEISTKAAQTKSIWFTVDANESSEPRSGVIVICNDNEVCIPVTVNQAAGKATLSISASSLEFGYEGGERQVTVTSNADWTSECSADWCYVTPISESGDCAVKVVVNANTEKKSRSATVTFKTGESSKTLTISQKPFETVFEISPRTQTVDAAGGTVTVTVTSNIGYQATPGVDWIHEIGTKADSGGSHMFAIDENKSLQKRTGIIVFCNDENVCIPAEIEQDGATALISISSSILEFSSSSGEKTVEITSNTSWTVSQKPQWCTLSPSSATGNTTVRVIVTENGNTVLREGKIVFSTGSATAELSVHQQPGNPELEISDTEFSFAGNGGEASFSITSNADWVVNTGASWLKASEESGTGNAVITLTADRNEIIEARTAQVTVKTKDGIIRKSITVSQAEGEPYLELNVYSLNFGSQEGRAEVSVSSNATWNVTSSDSWCTVEKNASSNSVSVCVKANDSGKNRSAQITVRTDKGGLEKTVTVSQSTPEDNEGFGDDGKIIWN